MVAKIPRALYEEIKQIDITIEYLKARKKHLEQEIKKNE